jgi:tetratricopeptide (TPR) repeat protein/TolB-like protein
MILPTLQLEPAYDYIVILVLFGFPVALILAWALEVTPLGIQKTADLTPEQLASETPERWRASSWVFAGIAIVAVLAAGYLVFFRDTQPNLREDLVIVFPLDNRTGDPSLDHLGERAADMIVEGLGWVAELRTVAMTEVRGAAGAGGRSHREIATELEAAVLITGSYSRRGGSLVFRAEGADVPTGEAIAHVETAAPSDEATAALEELQSRIAGGAALRGVVAAGGPRVWPTFEASLAVREASERFGASDWEGAGQWNLEAFDRDTTYLPSLLNAIITYSNLGDHATVDSLLTILVPRRTELGTREDLAVSGLVAGHEGDLQALLHARRSQLAVDTVNIGRQLDLSAVALQTGRPGEALAVLKSVEPDQLEQLSAAPTSWYWARVSGAHFWLGDYREALDASREGKSAAPESLDQRRDEILALVALNHLEEIDPLLDDVERMEPPEDGSGSPGSVYREVAAQLIRWGHVDRARTVAERAVDWYQARDPDRFQRATAQALLLADRPQEAVDLLELLVQENPENRTLRGIYGMALAQSGHYAEAEAVADWFEALDLPYLFGADSYWRAVILTHLGRAEEAVRLLREAYEAGTGLWDMSWDGNLLPLWEDEAFQQLVAPRGG